MNAEQLSFPSEPIVGETRATVELVANDWRRSTDEDWDVFESACRAVATWDGIYEGTDGLTVDPNRVRSYLTAEHGLTIEPRRYSAFWALAAGKNGFLDADGWVINTDAHGRNQGKPLRRYRLRSAS